MFEETLGGTLERSMFRFIGTFIGAVIGVPVLVIAEQLYKLDDIGSILAPTFVGISIFLFFYYIIPKSALSGL